MKNLQTLDKEGFLDVLGRLPTHLWTASIEHRCIHLRRVGSASVYSPLTAVYWHLTQEELHRGSFSHPEITERFHLSAWEIEQIAYAEICCMCSGAYTSRYSNKLRVALLEAVAPLIRSDGIVAYLRDLNDERLKSSRGG